MNFQHLSDEHKISIINAFQPIVNRDRLPLEQELVQTDRINFEKVLLKAFRIDQHYNAIKDSLLHLYDIRFAVKN